VAEGSLFPSLARLGNPTPAALSKPILSPRPPDSGAPNLVTHSGPGEKKKTHPQFERTQKEQNHDMRPLSFVLLFLSLVAIAASAKPSLPPWFCHGLDCPKYTLTATSPNASLPYEVRAYDRSVWVSTRVEARSLATAQAAGFRRLFAYISGANSEGAKVEMTAPVLTAVDPTPGAGPFCASNFTVSFFVPPAQGGSPPKPTDAAVFISSLPASTFYVASRGGWAWSVDGRVSRAAADLTAAVKADGRPVPSKKHAKKSPWFVAGYDPPFRLAGRHTEVWVQAPVEEEGGAADA
jgi:hypothetical protein